jgi:hypothetical protein
MNILSKFLDRKAKKETESLIPSEPVSTLEKESERIPPMDLFIDKEKPQQMRTENDAIPNKINTFLSRNYYSLGFTEGFEHHSNETLEIGLQKLKAEFQLIIDQAIQEKSLKRLEVTNLIVHVGPISEITRNTLENTVEEINASLATLKLQQQLCIENKGWVMNAIYSYHRGYIQGINDFINSEDFLNSIKNI